MSTRLLSTAMLDRSLIKRAEEQGIVLEALPFIEVTSNTEADIWAEVEEICALPVTAVFTSASAVKAVMHIIKAAKPQWTVYCVGNTTKKALLECFDEQAIKAVAADAAALAAHIITDDVCEVVFFCGDIRMDTLPELLRNDDITVHELIVYHTTETPHTVSGQPDGILFFSPSAVSSFFSINEVAPATILFAIGKTTADALKQRSGNTIIIAKAPSKEGLADEAIQYFHKQAPASAGAI